MKEKTIEWKCSSCGSVYDGSEFEKECPLCGSDEEQIKMNGEPKEIEDILIPKGKQKYISRYKKGRPVLKRKSKYFKKDKMR